MRIDDVVSSPARVYRRKVRRTSESLIVAFRREIEGDMCCRPCQHFGRFRWSVMVTIHVVANEKAHSRASQSVGCVVPAAGKPRDTHGRGGAISKDGHPLLIGILTSC